MILPDFIMIDARKSVKTGNNPVVIGMYCINEYTHNWWKISLIIFY